MARIDINGDIVTNEYGRFYDWFKWDYASPRKVADVINKAAPDEPLDVYINSGGGFVAAGQEIYSMLLAHRERVSIHIESLAASAASIIAMAGRSEISPVGVIMIHNVVGRTRGDYHEMEKYAEVLKQYNAALCAAYCAKTGRKLDDMLALMDRETWLTAAQAVKMGFVDSIMQTETKPATASGFDIRMTPELMERAEREMAGIKSRKEEITKDLFLYGI